MPSLSISAQAYGAPSWRNLLWVVPVTVVGPTLAFAFLRERITDVTRLTPFLSIPAIAIMLFMFAGLRKRQINIAIEGRSVTVTGWRRRPYSGDVTHVEVLPWSLPGLGVAQGAVACLQIDNTSSFNVGASDYRFPANATRSVSNVDCFVDSKTLASLLGAMGVQDNVEEPHSRDIKFTLVKYDGLKAVFGSMAWWFGTMAFLGLFGAVLGERLMQRPWGMAIVGIVSLLVIGFGLAKTFAHSQREKPKYLLTIARGGVQLCDSQGTTVWGANERSRATTQETYVYRTKYGSHRFPVLVLMGPQSALRLGVWDSQWQNKQAPVGLAPQFLVAASDWKQLLSALDPEN